MFNATPRQPYPWERDPLPILWEAEWAAEPVWTGAENLVPTGIRSPDPPALSESFDKYIKCIWFSTHPAIYHLHQFCVILAKEMNNARVNRQMA